MIDQKTPGLSLVLPTTGKPRNLFRVLDSLRDHAPASLLRITELIVFVNVDPITPVDFVEIGSYVDRIRSLFHTTRLLRADSFHLTAEESAFAAVSHATGEFLWIVGDKRIFLPEGLVLLDAFIRKPTASCVYFNSVWIDSDGHTNSFPSTHMSASHVVVPYKEFVMHGGVNFIATGMGTWIYRREFLDFDLWQHIIDHCGPHFSHVIALLAGHGDAEVLCYSTFLILLESKAYHSGDSSEWARYSKVAGTYRYYAWTFGLVRQFRFLIERGTYSYADVRRSFCSESSLLRRQIDEIYNHIFIQIRLGRTSASERITEAEFEELIGFLAKACPERAITHGLLKDLYDQSGIDNHKVFSRKTAIIQHGLALDHSVIPFASIIVGQVGDLYVRLHPKGYLLSKVKDNANFLLAYKLLDPSEQTAHWQILTKEDFASLNIRRPPQVIDDIFPDEVPRQVSGSLAYRTLTRRIVHTLYRSNHMAWLVSKLPLPAKEYLKSILL